jgi:hypothetical protein
MQRMNLWMTTSPLPRQEREKALDASIETTSRVHAFYRVFLTAAHLVGCKLLNQATITYGSGSHLLSMRG